MIVWQPVLGFTGMESAAQMVSVAFLPVVTMARQWGNWRSSAAMLVVSSTSRNLSEALSFSLRTAVAVS